MTSSGPPRIRIDECDEDQLAMAALLGCDPTTAERQYIAYFDDDTGRVEERPGLVVLWRGERRLIGQAGTVWLLRAPPAVPPPPPKLYLVQ
ncbi:hypothetical protein [Sphingomonas bacterium]|uniref:hypothetical protein n=1 Tax=Sphingomonas bacterium TaxID=1895847 RepID=UPI00157589D9|nr:hypothetical protein [Sphingomonas bacterium]